MTLEELKKLSPEQLWRVWWLGEFPFENASCGVCLTNHTSPCSRREVESHKALKAALPHGVNSDNLIKHLDELYALRLFFKDLYLYTPQVEEPQPVEEMVEAT